MIPGKVYRLRKRIIRAGGTADHDRSSRLSALSLNAVKYIFVEVKDQQTSCN
jgi:hypothetical protein